MAENTHIDSPQSRQALRRRLFWFLAGAGVNYLIISIPFKWLKAHTDLPTWAIAGCSMAISTSFFFIWNYFINFRTDARKRDALKRYLSAVGCMWLLSSTTLTLLKDHNFHFSFNLGHFPLDLDIIATQFFLSGLKFFLYHKWVFPGPEAAIMKWTRLVEQRIEEAIARGEFDDLPGRGQPLDLTEYFAPPAAERAGMALLKSAHVVPPEVELLKSIAALEATLQRHHHPKLTKQLREDLQEKRVAFALALERRRRREPRDVG